MDIEVFHVDIFLARL